MAEETETEVETRLRDALAIEAAVANDEEGIDVVVQMTPHSQQPILTALVTFPGIEIEVRVRDDEHLAMAIASFPEAMRQALEQTAAEVRGG